MMTDETRPEDFINVRRGDYSHIKGWGIDADPKNDPTYPMKQRTNEEHRGYAWERPEQQQSDVEILQSVERPNKTAVFGTSTPPSGLSGSIRRLAFKYSESSFGRWLPLVLADRINVYEGILDDLTKGRIPNIPKERGWAAEWRHNRTSMALKIAAVAAITTAVVAYAVNERNKRNRMAGAGAWRE